MMLMQEGSWHNAKDLGFSIGDEDLNDAFWVLLRKELVIQRLPMLGESVRIITYPAGVQRAFAYRDFWALDADGNTLAHAVSTWTLMDLKARKMSPIPPRLSEVSDVSVGEILPIPERRIGLTDSFDQVYTYKVGHYDLDWNHHVNNIITSKLMLQAVPKAIYDTKVLSTFKFQVKSELLPGDEVSVCMALVDDQYHHQLVHLDGRVISTGISKWK